MTNPEVRQRIAELVQRATEGRVPAGQALADGASLSELGLDSLGFLRLVDALELDFGVEVDLAGSGQRLDTVDDFAALLPEPGAR